MDQSKRAKYTAEFKAEAVRMVVEQGYTQAAVAKLLEISDKNISRWIKRAKQPPVSEQEKEALAGERQELQQLRQEIKRLRMEREILKKAAAFFANESD